MDSVLLLPKPHVSSCIQLLFLRIQQLTQDDEKCMCKKQISINTTFFAHVTSLSHQGWGGMKLQVSLLCCLQAHLSWHTNELINRNFFKYFPCFSKLKKKILKDSHDLRCRRLCYISAWPSHLLCTKEFEFSHKTCKIPAQTLFEGCTIKEIKETGLITACTCICVFAMSVLKILSH